MRFIHNYLSGSLSLFLALAFCRLLTHSSLLPEFFTQSDDVIQTVSGVNIRASKEHSDGEGEDALSGCLIELGA